MVVPYYTKISDYVDGGLPVQRYTKSSRTQCHTEETESDPKYDYPSACKLILEVRPPLALMQLDCCINYSPERYSRRPEDV